MNKPILTPELFERFRLLLGNTAGLAFDESKHSTLQSHLRDRARTHHCTTLEEYYDLVMDPAKGREELRKLIESVTIHETSFFRNHEHYRALREKVLPDLARRNATTRTLKIWSAGCSTGEEPYSLAITCLEHPQLVGWKIQVIASDLSERVLGIARRGIYRTETLRYIEPDRVARWFKRQTDDGQTALRPRSTGPLDPLLGQREVFSINDRVRALIEFQQLNLSAWPYPEIFTHFDLIICENVIIYFRPEVTRGTIDQFYNRLKPGGYLFLGYSETLWQISDRFTLMTYPNTFFYQRPEVEAPPAPPKTAATSTTDMLRKYGASPAEDATRPPPAPPPALRNSPSRPLGAPRSIPPPPPPPAGPTDGSVGRPGTLTAPGPAADLGLAIAVAEQFTQQGRQHIEAGRYAEAQAAFKSALLRNSSSVDALVGLAQIDANQGRWADARTACEKALEIDALCEEAHLLIALVHRQEGNTAEAIDHFEKLIYINFESIAGHYHLAEMYRAAQRPAEAAREYRRALWALSRHPSDGTISGIPATILRQTCEQQIRRLQK